MTKVLYDHQAFTIQDYGGVSRIFSELLSKDVDTKDLELHLSVLLYKNQHLKDTTIIHHRWMPYRDVSMLLNHFFNIYELKKANYDIYHPTYYNTSLLKYAKYKPVVATFHDMVHEKFSEKFHELKTDANTIENKRKMAHQADHIIAVSENTKQDLIEIYGLQSDKISVIHLGTSLTKPVDIKKSVECDYILYVGNRFAYKNFKFFLQCVAGMLVKNNVKLVCAGGRGFSDEETEIINQMRISNYVEHKEVNDEILSELYSNALCFVFPSLYEGFGIPVLEAFSCKCPCVLSNTSSLPEVAGDAAVYFDPSDKDSIIYAIECVLVNQSLQQELIEKGTQRLKSFSWSKMKNNTFEVYKKLL